MKMTRIALIALLAFTVTLPATAATYKIDGAHSSVIFKVKHFDVGNFYGAFKDVSGTIDYNASGESSIDLTIAADSVDTRNGQRDDHVKSPDFLNAAEFPKITFKATGVKASGDSFDVTGKLTLHGVTKDVTAKVEKTGQGKNPRSGKEMVGFEARFEVDRTQFDMGFMAGPLSKEVEFIVALEAVAE